MESFKYTLIQGNLKRALDHAGVGRPRGLYSLTPDMIDVIPGFNPRVDGPDLDAHIRTLADSMKSEGFYPDRPLSGTVYVNEAGEQRIALTKGHCRFRAFKLAVSEGMEATEVLIFIPGTCSDADDIDVSFIRDNDGGKPLTPYEKAVVCKRLSRNNNDPAEIARRTGLSVVHVRNYLYLMAAPQGIRALWAHGKVSLELAMETLKKSPHQAEAILTEMAAQVAQTNAATADAGKPAPSDRIKRSAMPGHKFALAIKRVAPKMHSVLDRISKDQAVLKALPSDLKADLEQLIAELQAKSDQPAPAASQVVQLKRAA
jgi:hypothetical protein